MESSNDVPTALVVPLLSSNPEVRDHCGKSALTKSMTVQSNMIRTAGDTSLMARWKVLSAITVGPPPLYLHLVDVKKGNLWYLNRKDEFPN